MTTSEEKIDISERYAYEGPRTPSQAEWEDAVELCRSIFFGNIPNHQEAYSTWPMHFRPEARESTFVMLYQGQPVSSINRLCRDIVVRGQALRMGFIGGVCTYPDHRGKGLAGTVLYATLQRFADDDVDFVYISGARPLYYRSGANHIGNSPVFFLTSDAQKSVDTKGLKIREAILADVEILRSLNESEETRIVHDTLDYEIVIQHGYCSGGQCMFGIVESGSTPVAYIALRGVEEKEGRWSQRVIEFAGDREAILFALSTKADEFGPNGHFVMEVRAEDELIDRLGAMGVRSEVGRKGGTVKILNFTRTMEKLLPYFASQLGTAFAESLEFTAGSERYVAAGEGGSLEIDGEANMLWTLLGNPPDKQRENVRATGLMEEALETCLPLPLPALYLNTI
ncbi:GNAT family N-acetyltransferase [Candidatus Poribacteria bacterium]